MKQKAKERAFANQHRSIFLRAGFRRMPGVDNKHFTFEGIKSELDDIFIFENVVLFVEYTLSSTTNLGSHAKGKAGSHNKISQNPNGFLQELSKVSDRVAEWLPQIPYSAKQLIFRLIYCSDPTLENHHKAFLSDDLFISRPERMYFHKLTNTIKKSARFELFDFLKVDPTRVGDKGVITSGLKSDRYHGSILPDEHSNFPPGFRIASFYVDPEALLKRAYVLRQGGWRDSLNLYQRMIIPGKINSIRRYLREQHRVFANNIVITLPDDTEFRDNNDDIIDSSKISSTTFAWVVIRDKPNSVGIVDGQHRVFSYYEDLQPDKLIDHYRRQQNLLATGIVYPKNTNNTAKEQFEASLFLEINSNQAGARSDLKQAIWLILDPFRPISVARMIVNNLASLAPLNGIIEKSVYDIGRLRTTTIVTYGIQPLVKRSGGDSLFSIWKDSDKDNIVEGNKDPDVLERYLTFCTDHIADFLSIVRDSIDKEKWRIVDKEGSGVLSVTAVNSFIILMRKLIESGHLSEKHLNVSLTKLNGVDFKNFKSSQYAALAATMYNEVI